MPLARLPQFLIALRQPAGPQRHDADAGYLQPRLTVMAARLALDQRCSIEADRRRARLVGDRHRRTTGLGHRLELRQLDFERFQLRHRLLGQLAAAKAPLHRPRSPAARLPPPPACAPARRGARRCRAHSWRRRAAPRGRVPPAPPLRPHRSPREPKPAPQQPPRAAPGLPPASAARRQACRPELPRALWRRETTRARGRPCRAARSSAAARPRPRAAHRPAPSPP